jgi:hypothetical protein
MMFDFSDSNFNLKINARIRHQKRNFYLKNYENNFDEKYYFNDGFRIVDLKQC